LRWVGAIEEIAMRTDTERLRAEAHARLQERLRAAGHTLSAANRSWQQTRPGMLVQQYRDSEFHGRTKHAVRVRFRLPLDGDPAPEPRRLALVAGWAGALGMAGVIVLLPVLTSLFRPSGGWYVPTMMLVGLVGVGATAGAFASIHRRRAPWIGLWIGTAALALAVVLTALR
jgi:hypothetical protein